MYLYIKALHIIFIVTWFSGMFYIVRLFIYNTEAAEKTGPEREILRAQFRIMIRRLMAGYYLAFSHTHLDIRSLDMDLTG